MAPRTAPSGFWPKENLDAPMSVRIDVVDGKISALLFALDVHRVVGYRLRGDFLEPVGRLCRNRNHVTFAQMVGRSAFERGSTHLIRRGTLGVNHSPSHY